MPEDNQEQQGTQQPEDSQQQAPPEAGASASERNQDNYWRRQAEKAEKRIKDLERQSMSELERVRLERDEFSKENAALRGELTDFKTYQSFEKSAKQAGVLDPETAYLLAKNKGKVELAEDGRLIGAEQFLKDLRATKPHFFENGGQLGTGGGKRQQAQGRTPGESLRRWVDRH